MATAKMGLGQNPSSLSDVFKGRRIVHMRNENIRREFDIFSIHEKINKYREEWEWQGM